MKRMVFLCGVFLSCPVTVSSSESLLKWCVDAYPRRIEWCKSQYPGEITPPEIRSSALPISSSPQQSATKDATFENMLGKVSQRLTNKFSTYNLGMSGRFNASAETIANAVKFHLAFADISFDNSADCNQQKDIPDRGSYLDCSIYEKNADFTVSASSASGSSLADRVEISYFIREGDQRKTDIFTFSVVADALSRMLDSEISDDQRAAIFSAAGESYFSSGRKEGMAKGRNVKYIIKEEDGNLFLVVTALPSQAQRSFIEKSVNPIVSLSQSLNRVDLIKPDPLEAPEVKAVIARKREMVRDLLGQLDVFRYARRFHEVGFIENQPYRKWYTELSEIYRADSEIIKQAGSQSGAFSAALSLYNLAMEYMHNGGRDTSDSIYERVRVMKFIDSK